MIKMKWSTYLAIKQLSSSIRDDSKLVRLVLYSVYPKSILKNMSPSIKPMDEQDCKPRIDDNVRLLIKGKEKLFIYKLFL